MMPSPTTPTTEDNLLDKVRRDARRLVTDSESPDDLFQQAVLFYLENHPQIRKLTHKNPPAFIRKRCYFEMQHILTRDRRIAAHFESIEARLDNGRDLIDESANPEDMFIEWETERETERERQALAALVASSIQYLPSRQRHVAEMRVAGHRPAEIARQLGVRKSNVTQIMNRARSFLMSVCVAA